MERAIDISNYQGVVPVEVFLRMKETGVTNVIIRSSYTQGAKFVQREDASFKKNIVNAYKANLRIGIYHFSQAVSETEATEEARYCLKTIEPYKRYIHLPVAIDWEFYKRLNSYVADKAGKQRCKQICDAFCREIRKAGYEPMVYANLSTLRGYIAEDIYKTWKIWVAQYARKCDYRHDVFMWQYTSSGTVSGISGKVDLSYLYRDDPKPQGITYPGKLPTLPARGWFTSGDTGTQVKLLQVFLNWFFGYEQLKVDGEVGRLTMDAVRDYERAEGLTVDGAFGEKCLQRARIVRR